MSETSTSKGVLAPVKKSITVSIPVEKAFELFTSGISTWWPLVTHSVGEQDAVSCFMEEKEGGRIYEVMKDGTQADWGMVLTWEPPDRLVFTWHPGRDANTAQKVEVLFEAEDGSTRVTLTHFDWEILGERAKKLRDGYDTGWDYVLGFYTKKAENSH